MTDLSDRLKEIAPDLAGFAKDLGDTKILLTLMAELLTNDDLSEETIDRFFCLWRAVWPLLDAAHSELRSIMQNLDR